MPTCSSETTWCTWTANCTTSSSCTSTATIVWDQWCETETCTATSTATNTVWRTWSTTGTIASTVYRSNRMPAPKPLTAEEQATLEAERLQRLEEYRVAQEKADAEKKAADDRAERLLRSTLTLRQRLAYRRNRAFVVQARDGTRFRLKKGWAGNVEELDPRGRPVNRFCIHPRELVPEADNLVAQKLLLETDPAAFRRIANRTAIPQPATVAA